MYIELNVNVNNNKTFLNAINQINNYTQKQYKKNEISIVNTSLNMYSDTAQLTYLLHVDTDLFGLMLNAVFNNQSFSVSTTANDVFKFRFYLNGRSDFDSYEYITNKSFDLSIVLFFNFFISYSTNSTILTNFDKDSISFNFCSSSDVIEYDNDFVDTPYKTILSCLGLFKTTFSSSAHICNTSMEYIPFDSIEDHFENNGLSLEPEHLSYIKDSYKEFFL